jgi:hypothetical protein
MTEVHFERRTLYEEVWTTPLTHLAKKYGLSDNGIRKVCKALNIPLPEHGHWAKVAAGRKTTRAELPQMAERTTFVSRRTGDERDFAVAEDEVWLREQIAFEEAPEHRIVFQEKPSRWHKVIASLREDLRQAARELEASRRAEERMTKHPRLRQQVNWDGAIWRSSVDRGQILNLTHKPMPLRVSPLGYERALAILNSLAVEAERRNFTVAFNESRARIEFAAHGGTIEVRITERLEDKWRTEKNDWEKKPRSVRYQAPTGDLRLYIGDSWSESETADTKSARLEEKLNAVFIGVYGKVIRQRERERKHEAQRRESEAEEAKREAVARRRREEEAARERERRRRRALIVEAKQWKAAALIREYVSHMAHTAGDARTAAAWVTWATNVANALDPTLERAELLKVTDGAFAMIRRFPQSSD